MSKGQKIALLMIWLGILGSLGAVLGSWQVRQQSLAGELMTVRRNLLTHEEDVQVNGLWVPLPEYERNLKQGPGLVAQLPPDTPATDPGAPTLPYAGPLPEPTDGEYQSQLPDPADAQVAQASPQQQVEPIAPDSPQPDPQAATELSDGEQSEPSGYDGIPVVRAPSEDGVQAWARPPSLPHEGPASAGNGRDQNDSGGATAQAQAEPTQPPA